MNVEKYHLHHDTEFYIEIDEFQDKPTNLDTNEIDLYISSFKTKPLPVHNVNHLKFMYGHFFSKESCTQENIYFKQFSKYQQNSITKAEMSSLKDISMKCMSYNIYEVSTRFSDDNQVQSNNFLKHKLKRSYLTTEVMRSVYKPMIGEDVCKVLFKFSE
jgi:hypothetical protein